MSDRDGTNRIYVANADGSGAMPIARGSSPAWSPDGSQIAFAESPWGNGPLFTISPAGSGLRSLKASGADPAWSPDGRRIAFGASNSWPYTIEVIDVDGSNPVRVHSTEDYASQPAWSPDGRRIAFHVGSYIDDHSGVWVVGADASGVRRLGPWDSGRPVWSSDGSRIAYTSQYSGIQISNANDPGEICMFSLGCRGAFTLVSGPNVSLGDWSPDGQQIVFSRYTGVFPNRSCRIYIVNPTGGAERQLVPDVDVPGSPAYCDSQPIWARP